ncbi:MAG TPA: hypothetical protein VKA61_02555, partial [Sphingomicrobium sp.]|nr:hypothetical protein [Sphingomicrobium sp.]
MAALDAFGPLWTATCTGSLIVALAMVHSRSSSTRSAALILLMAALMGSMVGTGTAATDLLAGRAPSARVTL